MDNNTRDKVFGFFQAKTPDKFSVPHLRMMAVVRLSESVEAWRMKQLASIEQFRNMIETAREQTASTEAWYAYWFPVWYEKYVKGSVEDKLVESAFRLLVLAGQEGYDIKPKTLRTKDERSFVEVADAITYILPKGKDGVNEALSLIMNLFKRIGYQRDMVNYMMKSKMTFFEYRGFDNGKRF